MASFSSSLFKSFNFFINKHGDNLQFCPHLSFSFYFSLSLSVEVTSEDFSLEDFLCKNKLVSSYWVHWSLLVHSPQPQIIPADAYCIWLKGCYSLLLTENVHVFTFLT